MPIPGHCHHQLAQVLWEEAKFGMSQQLSVFSPFSMQRLKQDIYEIYGLYIFCHYIWDCSGYSYFISQ